MVCSLRLAGKRIYRHSLEFIQALLESGEKYAEHEFWTATP